MAISNAYLTQVKNLKDILTALRDAQAPERFTIKFLGDLGFRSTNDRPIIGVLKALGFIDESGVPRPRYFEYLDDESQKRVLADGIREAYADIFKVNNKANEMDVAWVKNKLRTLTQGTKSDAVLPKMATTFVALCEQADFAATSAAPKLQAVQPTPPESAPGKTEVEAGGAKVHKHGLGLSYNINIELPAVRDQAVYDAIFKALKDHLL